MTEPEKQDKPTDTAWTIDPTLTYQTFVEHERPRAMKPYLRRVLTTDVASEIRQFVHEAITR